MEDEKLNKILLTDIKIYSGYTMLGLIGSILFESYANSGYEIKDHFAMFIFALASMCCIALHIFLRLLTAIIFFANGNWEMGKACLLGIFVVLLIGVPICNSARLFK